MKNLVMVLLLVPVLLKAQELKTPLENKNYTYPTSYNELTDFVNQLSQVSSIVKVEIIGTSAEGRNIYALEFSSSVFGSDSAKAKVLLLAQQHGNEQSGKEGALLLAAELIKPENQYLLAQMDVAIIPQMNPDGSELNKRRNGNNMDLNRNHMISTEPEIIALHRFFDRYLFEVTMDIHEFAPFESWDDFPYYHNADELIGCNTNCNIPVEIRDFQNHVFVPFYRKYLTEHQFTNSLYAPGGPPEVEYIRHSTYDINDGRQSFGIQNSLSFIQEGLNGRDCFKDSLEHRSLGQMTGMQALLEFACQNKKEIKEMVFSQRQKLMDNELAANVAIQMEHVKNGSTLEYPVHSTITGNDSVFIVNDYRPVVKSIYNVAKPVGYLVPKNNSELVSWINRMGFETRNLASLTNFKIEQYQVNAIDSMDFEGDMIVNPDIQSTLITSVKVNDYLFIPVDQLKGVMLITALEPKSELGLVTYPLFSHLLKAGENFPVLRVIYK